MGTLVRTDISMRYDMTQKSKGVLPLVETIVPARRGSRRFVTYPRLGAATQHSVCFRNAEPPEILWSSIRFRVHEKKAQRADSAPCALLYEHDYKEGSMRGLPGD